jgi:hypothetical protein
LFVLWRVEESVAEDPGVQEIHYTTVHLQRPKVGC